MSSSLENKKISVNLPEDLQLKLERILEEHNVTNYWIEVRERIFCGKYSRCTKCATGQGHLGPYYYVHFRDGNGKLKTKYLGKPKNPRRGEGAE